MVAASVIIFLTVVAYIPAMRGGFVWDDDDHLTKNPAMLSGEGLKRIWSSLEVSRYYPLTLTSFWVQRRLWGLNPMPYHVVNIVLHGINGVLVFLVLRRLRIRAAWLAATLWALHPVNVESVAWITELKNVQAGFFFFGTLLCYLRFEERKTRFWYALALLCGASAFLSKPSTVVLPLVLLLYAWWQRGACRRVDLVRSLPFFVLALAMSALTIVEQRGHVTRQASDEWSLETAERVIIAGRAIWFYACKVIWPADLVFVYPRWHIAVNSSLQWLPLVGLLAGGVVLWAYHRQSWARATCFGLGFFLAALLPVLGFFDVYYFRYSFVADHFQYLADLGILALAASGIAHALDCMGLWSAVAGNTVCSVLVALLAAMSWRQSLTYRNEETLFRTTIQHNPSCWMAYNNLGLLLVDTQPEDAIRQYQLALQIKPNYAEAHNNWGVALVQMNRVPEAIEHYEHALRIKPDYPEVNYNLGIALIRAGRMTEAVRPWQSTLQARPNDAEAHYNFGVVLGQLGKDQEAIGHWEAALRLKPDLAEAHFNLGVALVRLGRTQEAMDHWQEALRHKPDYPEAHYNLGISLEKAGKVQEAIKHWEQAVRLKPDYTEARNQLARVRVVP
jgi:tetratricopeptide (TPR) repeat protein